MPDWEVLPRFQQEAMRLCDIGQQISDGNSHLFVVNVLNDDYGQATWEQPTSNSRSDRYLAAAAAMTSL